MKDLTTKERILKERAAQISQPTLKEKESETAMLMLEFLLSDEHYALDSRYVKEVCFINALTPIPCTPDFVLGVVNLRGEILSVLDVKRFFNLPHKGITNLNRVIVVQHQGVELGILADEIIGERKVVLERLQNDISNITKNNDEFVEGLTEDRLIVLNIEAFLSSEKIIVNDSI